MGNPKVQILLAIHNGEKHLWAQLESIARQSYDDWELIIGDDNSTDQSWNLIQGFVSKHPNKVKAQKLVNGGSASASFMALIACATSEYIMLCDQDDVWNLDKVQLSIEHLTGLEKSNKVALVYSDMEVVDENLQTLKTSFLRQHGLDPAWIHDTKKVLVQSLAAGCTMMFTQALKQKLQPINSKLFMHDHWLMIHAALHGDIGFIPQPTLKYRQHSHNSVGSHGISSAYFLEKIKAWKENHTRFKYLHKQLPVSYSPWRLWLTKVCLNLQRPFKVN